MPVNHEKDVSLGGDRLSTMNEAQTLPKQLPGSVHAQFVKCGRRWCRCMKAGGRRHGPYLYWFRREAGCLRKTYIKAAHVEQVRAACLAWQQSRSDVRKGWTRWRAKRDELHQLEEDARDRESGNQH